MLWLRRLSSHSSRIQLICRRYSPRGPRREPIYACLTQYKDCSTLPAQATPALVHIACACLGVPNAVADLA